MATVLTDAQKARLRDRIRNGPPKPDAEPGKPRIKAKRNSLNDAVRTALRSRLEVDPLPDDDPTPKSHDDLAEAEAAVSRLERTDEQERTTEWYIRHEAACGVVDRIKRDRERQQQMNNEAELSAMMSNWHHG